MKNNNNNNNFKAVLSAALVAAAVSAAGIGLFVANQSRTPALKEQVQTPPVAAPKPEMAAPAETAFTDSQRKSIEAMVREYLVKNPEILIEMSALLEGRQAKAEQQSRETAIAQNADAIFRAKNPIIAGNPNGDVTVVEFFDYNCGYCKRAFSSLVKLMETDPNVRVVLKEFPIFGERSVGAAKVAIAAQKQGKYFELHSELLKSRQVTKDSALRIAEKLGLDIEKLKQDMDKPEVQAVITETRQLAERLGIQGTPFYLVGDQTIPGAPENLYDMFVENVAKIRKEGCSVAC